eukprot:TRINITY_DN13744_c0_g1_i1.p1 TRINITY_DN13744_c0_g1~~TRINITY_DN13744_c0_g1_i1.p1  ORF type:complete len:477 (+),score=69.48 TRINITY_DN13744_c0_g1_i1:160-1590(+)
MPVSFIKRASVVAGGFFSQVILGAFYIWGGVSIYFASHLRQYDKSFSIALANIAFPFTDICLHLSMPFGVALAERFGTRLVIFVFVTIDAISVFLSSYTTTFWFFFLSYAIVPGLCKGVVNMITCYAGWVYFPNHRGRVAGIVYLGFGLGTFFYTLLATMLVNPANARPTVEVIEGQVTTFYFTDDIASRVPQTLRILSATYIVIGWLGALLIHVPHFDIEKHSMLEHDSLRRTKSMDALAYAASSVHSFVGDQSRTTLEKEVKRAVRSKAFWILLISGFCSTVFGFFALTTYKTYGLQFIQDDNTLSVIGSFGAIASAFGRCFWGFVVDKLAFIKVYVVMILGLLFSTLLIAPAAESSNPFLYGPIICAIFFFEAGHFTIFPMITVRIFGDSYGFYINGIISFNFCTSNLVSFIIASTLLPQIGFDNLLRILYMIQLLPLLIIFVLDEKEIERMHPDHFRISGVFPTKSPKNRFN